MRYVLRIAQRTKCSYNITCTFHKGDILMKMMHRMILFDLDGTLLTSDGTVCSTTANIIKCCKQEGHYIGYITARSRSKKNIRLLDGLPCDFTAFYNGAVICAGNQLIESNVLSYKQVTSILQRLNKDFSRCDN